MHLTESELNEKSISVLKLTMTDSEVSKHPMENKLAVMVNHSRVACNTVQVQCVSFTDIDDGEKSVTVNQNVTGGDSGEAPKELEENTKW